MNISRFIDFFIHNSYFENRKRLQQARLLVRSSLLTSLFSNSYIWLSVVFEYPKGVSLMIMDVFGFLLLPFLVKTRLRLEIIGNLYVLIGASAIIVLTYYSGGIESGIYPWIIAIPILAMLVVNRRSSLIWFVISLSVMVWYGWLAGDGFIFPIEYNQEYYTLWFVSILTGLLTIIYVITYVFASMRSSAISFLEEQNEELNTERQRVADQSEQMTTLVEEKDQIIRMLAHDISNALNIVDGSLNLLADDSLTKEQSELIDNANSSTTKAMKLVNKALNIGKMENQEIHVHFEELNLHQLISEALRLYTRTSVEKQIHIENRIPKDHFVFADKTYLNQILDNLISNAIKYSEAGGTVTCSANETQHSIYLKISDQGKGIPAREMSELFKPFSRISTSPTGGETSKGVGLSLVKHYAELMGGSVQCESEEGKGSTFILSLLKSRLEVY